jgi:uncharacterized membrane protein YkvA (DUF1232 family)
MNKRSSGSIIPTQGGAFRDLVLRVKLIVRLVGDKRVNPWLKILPIGGLLYLISPLDLIPDLLLPVVGELDDIAILWLTNYFFIEMCPPEIVREHVKQLVSNNAIVDEVKQKPENDDVIDGEATDIK